jgi:hypothetical protein
MDQILNAKQRWAARHTQIKITVHPEIADQFKALCAGEGVSMTSKLKSYIDGLLGGNAEKLPAGPYTTRQKRRKALKLLIREVEEIMKAEQRYVDQMPENLESAPMHEAAELAIDSLDEALEILRNAFQY